MKLGPLSPTLQTLYSELVQQLETAPAAGSVYRRTLEGVEYVYAKLPVGITRVDRFLGRANDPEVEQAAEALRRGTAAAADRRRLVSMLRRQGLAGPDRTMGAILDALAWAGLFKAGAVLVGTAAYGLSEPLAGTRLPAPSLMTADVDLATANLALRSEPPERFEAILRRADPTFEGVPQLKPLAPPSRFRNAQGYLVDLVAPIRKRSDQNPVPLEDLRAGAAPLQHLAWLIEAPVQVAALWGAGILVDVPQPARFAVHKLILAQKRDAGSRVKRAKDLAQATAMLDALRQNDPFALSDALTDASARGAKGWAEPIERSLREIDRQDLMSF
ncbi:MAG: hypothetical protein K2X07_03135 [Caulobacteraceae bacterium]|nr:hypothetical protein [Caulobacteraceae bacterium]